MAETGPLCAFKDAALIIVAHGSPGHEEGRTSTLRMAARLGAMNVFAAVHAAFLAEPPFADDILEAVPQREVYIVPNLAADGFIAREKLPRILKLTGHLTQRIDRMGRRRILLSAPVGTHPLVGRVLGERIGATMRKAACEVDKTAVIIVGHGSQRDRKSFERTTQTAKEMAVHGIACPTWAAFLEEPPFVKDWRKLLRNPHTACENVIFAPLLISQGSHSARDIPSAIGFAPAKKRFQARLAADEVNEITRDGRRIFYLPPVGNADAMADIILARAKQAHEAA